VYADEGNLSRIFCWVGEVDFRLKIQSCFARAKNFEVTDLGLEVAEAFACRDRCNLISLNAVGLT
jgi:hypothetical protein